MREKGDMDDEPTENLPAVSHPLASHIGFLLRRVQLAVFSDFQTRTATFEITPSEYAILQVLHASPRMQQNRLAEIIGVKPANCVVLINGLEKRHLLIRRAYSKKLPQGRALALSLTMEGKEFLKKMNIRVLEHQKFLVDLLGVRAHEELRDHLTSLLDQADRGLLG